MKDLDQLGILLGTANWGWTTDKQQAFALLEAFMKTGLREVDGATNYPINKVAEDFRASEQILLEFIKTHGLSDLAITMKVGSLDNLRSPDHNLSPSFLEMMTEEYLRLFGDNLQTIMIHWDNREDEGQIRESLSSLLEAANKHGLRVGFSGLANPDAYHRVLKDAEGAFDIQFKHNILKSDLEKYRLFNPEQFRFCAYGINAGGIKLDGNYAGNSSFLARGGEPKKVKAMLETIQKELPDWNLASVRPPIKKMNQLGLIYALYTAQVRALLLGVSTIPQLNQSLEFIKDLTVFEYEDVYKKLRSLQ